MRGDQVYLCHRMALRCVLARSRSGRLLYARIWLKCLQKTKGIAGYLLWTCCGCAQKAWQTTDPCLFLVPTRGKTLFKSSLARAPPCW